MSQIPFIDLNRQQQRILPEIERRIGAVLKHGQYVLGPEIAELEGRLAAYTGAKHCITVSSGTDALLIALMAIGIVPGDEVITTPFTFIATGEVISLLGAVPVFVDIDPRTYNIDPNLIESAITPRTRAIMPVSLYGQCADFDAINAIAAKHNQTRGDNTASRIHVIEDACQSFGATYKSRKSCALSDIGCTSFFPSKPLGCYGDGGACFTDDDAVAAKIRQVMNHGQDRRYHHPIIGINGRCDTLQAAILLAKMDIFEEEVKLRADIGAEYSTKIASAAGSRIVTPFIESWNTSVYAQYTILVNDREKVQSNLQAKGIPTAVHYPVPLHLQPAFAGVNKPEGSFPVSENIARQVMSLPMHPYLNENDMERIVTALAEG